MIELLILGLIILSVVCLWILIERRKEPKFLIWFIPTLLILITSTYLTYTSILGFPKFGRPPAGGLYITHFVDEPYWIYLWVIEGKAPRSYQMNYSRKIHDSLEGVKSKSEGGSFMILKDSDEGNQGEQVGEDKGGGYTVGGDISFYKWEFTDDMLQKD
tara:strand:- start:285 stop:761 length:477 start_codon:yes stop_codon:yes gene_type:complete